MRSNALERGAILENSRHGRTGNLNLQAGTFSAGTGRNSNRPGSTNFVRVGDPDRCFASFFQRKETEMANNRSPRGRYTESFWRATFEVGSQPAAVTSMSHLKSYPKTRDPSLSIFVARPDRSAEAYAHPFPLRPPNGAHSLPNFIGSVNLSNQSRIQPGPHRLRLRSSSGQMRGAISRGMISSSAEIST